MFWVVDFGGVSLRAGLSRLQKGIKSLKKVKIFLEFQFKVLRAILKLRYSTLMGIPMIWRTALPLWEVSAWCLSPWAAGPARSCLLTR